MWDRQTQGQSNIHVMLIQTSWYLGFRDKYFHLNMLQEKKKQFIRMRIAVEKKLFDEDLCSQIGVHGLTDTSS